MTGHRGLWHSWRRRRWRRRVKGAVSSGRRWSIAAGVHDRPVSKVSGAVLVKAVRMMGKRREVVIVMIVFSIRTIWTGVWVSSVSGRATFGNDGAVTRVAGWTVRAVPGACTIKMRINIYSTRLDILLRVLRFIRKNGFVSALVEFAIIVHGKTNNCSHHEDFNLDRVQNRQGVQATKSATNWKYKLYVVVV